MKPLLNDLLKTEKPWRIDYNSEDQFMELTFTEDIADTDIDEYLRMLNTMFSFVPVKTLLINDKNIKGDALGLDWLIIELSCEAICRNGGEKIIIVHQSELPIYLEETYYEAFKNHGIPIKLEFRTDSMVQNELK